MVNNFLKAAALFTVAIFGSSSAQAATVACGVGSGLPCIATGTTYTGPGNSGNDQETFVEKAIEDATGTFVDISLYGKTDDNPTLFSGNISKTISSGTWNVLSGTLIRFITVKAANGYTLYDVGNVSSGNWTTLGLVTGQNNNQPNLSHISFWTDGSTPPVVPLPAAGWMLLAGVGGLAAMRRRKKRS